MQRLTQKRQSIVSTNLRITGARTHSALAFMRFLTSSLDKHHLLKWVFQESRRFQRNPSGAYCIIIILSSINIITDSSSNLHKRYNCNMKFQHEGCTIQLTSRIFRRIFCAHKIKMVSTMPSQAKNRFYGFWCCISIAWAR